MLRRHFLYDIIYMFGEGEQLEQFRLDLHSGEDETPKTWWRNNQKCMNSIHAPDATEWWIWALRSFLCEYTDYVHPLNKTLCVSTICTDNNGYEVDCACTRFLETLLLANLMCIHDTISQALL